MFRKILSRNIPQYLYHITTKQSYNSIIKDGMIHASGDCILNKKAVFAVEKNNYLKEWQNIFVGKENVQDMLVKQVSFYGHEPVVLKISTKDLNPKKLFVRNQRKFFDFKNGKYDTLPKSPMEFVRSVLSFLHLRYGTSAFWSKFYNKHKAYEYIYKDEIKVSNIDNVIPLDEFLSH